MFGLTWTSSQQGWHDITFTFVTDGISRNTEIINCLWISDLQTLSGAIGPEEERRCAYLSLHSSIIPQHTKDSEVHVREPHSY